MIENKIRLSYSTLELIHSCERKFQLIKLLENSIERDEAVYLTGGTAFGMGVAHYLVNQDKEAALFELWINFWPELSDAYRDQYRYLAALEAAFATLDNLLLEWEVPFFDNKPAAELSFALDINDNYYYVGYVDVTLKNRFTEQLAVLEVKHTSSWLLDLRPMYQNSGQALGYSIVLDKIAGENQSSYSVLYLVAKFGKDYIPETKLFVFNKTLLDRLNWFLTLGLDVEKLERMAELGQYPMRGGSCISYNRPCVFFGTCHLHSLDFPKIIEPDEEEYQFQFRLDDLINDHIRRVTE